MLYFSCARNRCETVISFRFKLMSPRFSLSNSYCVTLEHQLNFFSWLINEHIIFGKKIDCINYKLEFSYIPTSTKGNQS